MLFVMVGQELSLLLLPDATGILYDGRTAPLAACDRIVGNLVTVDPRTSISQHGTALWRLTACTSRRK